VLAAHTDAQVVADTAMGSDLLQPLKILTQSLINKIGVQLPVLAGLDILLSIEEPDRDLKVEGLHDHLHKLLDLILGQLTSTLGGVNLSLLADEAGESPAHTLDHGQRKLHFAAAINVGIENTQNVLEIRADDKR